MEIKAFLSGLKGKTVGIDTMSFIYAFEEHPRYLPIVKPLFQNMEKGVIKGVTSTITITECLVRPFEAGDITLLAKYRTVFKHFPNLAVVPPIHEVAEKAAELRAAYKIRTPDALQLAAALLNGASVFITNDGQLSKVAGIKIVVLDDLAAG